jgi:hypothetical protein
LAIAFFFVPAVVSLVPAHNTITSPLAFVVILGYLAAVGFAFLTPRIASWPAIAYAVLICAAVALYTSTYLDRARTGEYAWPVFDFYLVEGNEPLFVGKDHMQVLTDSDIARLKTIGLRGEVNWYGRSGNAGAASVIVICRARPDEPKRIHFPKAGRVLFIYDGDRWMTVPASFESYERFVTLQTDGMLSQELSSGGVQSSRVYMTW